MPLIQTNVRSAPGFAQTIVKAENTQETTVHFGAPDTGTWNVKIDAGWERYDENPDLDITIGSGFHNKPISINGRYYVMNNDYVLVLQTNAHGK